MADNINSLRAPITQSKTGILKPPESIIQTVQSARSIYFKFRNEHLNRIALYSRITGVLEGNPPYSPAELAESGLSHIANFNTLDARSMFERGALAYWNLLNEAKTICKFEITGFEEGQNGPELLEWADTMAYHFDTVVRAWPSFYTQVNTLTAQLVTLGLSPCIWHDERDWRWRVIELSRFFVQDQALSDIEQLTAVCLESTFTVQYLFEIYEQYKDKDSKTWNTDELAKELMYWANSYTKPDNHVIDMMDLQRRVQNNDTFFDSIFTDSIRLVSMLYKEYDGKISHYMFDRWYNHSDFIYKVVGQYESMQEALVIFTASPGEFTLHSNKGLGHKIFSGAQAMMQLDCSIVDAARMAATPFIKSMNTGTDFEPIRVYPGVFTNIGNAEFTQSNFGSNIEQLIGVSQYFLQKMNYNTVNSGDDPSVPDKSIGSLSPVESKFKSYKEFGVLKNNIAHFYSQFDLVIQNMVIKMLKSKSTWPGYDSAKEWKDRCIADGVPDFIFSMRDTDIYGMPAHLTVRATRVAGDGSTSAKILGLESLQPYASSFDQKGQQEYVREVVLAHMGKEYVDAFVGSTNPDETTGGASLAGVENAVMQLGQSPLFSKDNDQRAHISTHFALGNQTIQMIQQQQMSPIDADKVFTVLIPHMSEHVRDVQQDIFSEPFFESIRKPWEQLADYARLNRKNAEAMLQAQIKKAQAQQEQTEQAMSDEEIKNFKAQGDSARADTKVQSQVERAKEANQTRADVMREKVHLDAANKQLEVKLNAQAKKGQQQESSLEDLRAQLRQMNGSTPSPSDIEGKVA